MSTELYSAETHVFSNPNGSDIYIKPQEGQNLYIEGFTSGDVLPGHGLDKTGEELNVLVDELSLEINGENKLQVKDQGIITSHIMNAAVTVEKLQQASVTIVAGDGLIGGGAVELGSEVTVDVDETVVRTTGSQSITGDKFFNRLLLRDTGTEGLILKTADVMPGTITLTLPPDDGTSGQVLTTDGTGVLSWAANGIATNPAGSDMQVQYNSGGSFGAEAGFTYNSTSNTLAVPTVSSTSVNCSTATATTVISETVESQISSDYFGTNSLSSPENLPPAATSQNNGNSVTITKYNQAIYNEGGAPLPLRTRIYIAAPYDTGDPNYFGGMVTGYNSDAGSYPSGQSILAVPETGTELPLGDVDTNNDGSFMVLNQATASCRVYAYLSFGYLSTSGGWPQVFTGFTKARISGNYIAISNETNNLSVYLFNGSTFALQQKVSSAAVSHFDICNDNLLYFLDGTNVRAWTRSGTNWVFSNTIAVGSGVTKIVADGALLVTRKTDYVTIYESSAEVMSLLDPGVTDICTDGANYVCYCTGGTDLRVISKTSGSWTVQVNPTVTDNVASLACNSHYLVVGRPSANGATGRTTVYDISTYTPTMLTNNTIGLSNPDVDMTITSEYGSITTSSSNFLINSPLNVTGNFTFNDNFYKGTTLCSVPMILAQTTYTNINYTPAISIPGGINHLRIIFSLSRSSGSGPATIGLRCNGVFSSVYHSQTVSVIGSSFSASTASLSFAPVAFINGGSSSAVIDMAHVKDLNYYKIVHSNCGVFTGSTSSFRYEGTWASNAAITSIEFVSDSGSINFSGFCTVYGYL